jgi:hypothetical protein
VPPSWVAHGYAEIDHAKVYDIVVTHAPQLLAAVSEFRQYDGRYDKNGYETSGHDFPTASDRTTTWTPFDKPARSRTVGTR